MRHSNTPPYYISIHAPREGATLMELPAASITSISIHAPREGGDASGQTLQGRDRQFQSTPPREGGDNGDLHITISGVISIHAPREGGDDTF